ncbi:hypothetical protein VPH35_100895 [Triticum aestivum]
MKSSTLVAVLLLQTVMVMGILAHSQPADAHDDFPKCCDHCNSWSGAQFCDDVGPKCRDGCVNCRVVQTRPVKTFRYNFPKCCDNCNSWSGYQFCEDVGPRCRRGCANCQVVQMSPVKTFRCGDGRPVYDGHDTPTPCPPPCKKH